MLPKNFTFYQAFVGDASDNIQGIKGVGPKTAIKLINNYETIEKFKNDTGSKYYKFIEDFNKSFELVTLSIEVPIKEQEYSQQNFEPTFLALLCL